MALSVSGFSFDGPFDVLDDVEEKSGVYVVVDRTSSDARLLDCGESCKVKDRRLPVSE